MIKIMRLFIGNAMREFCKLEERVGGRMPVNTDGGLLANGEPIGASGLRQVNEVVLQLRGKAGERQVPGGPKVGYTQLYGAPGVAGVSILCAPITPA